jgi:DNA-binding transcriptional MerR regulator/methylmalonyl-CoA mutase cobalamin-binding subunit
MDNHEALYSIGVASKRSGLTQDVIRVWEKRYRAITPKRSKTGRRLYSDQDIRRLLLLHRATSSGHRIGNIANLNAEELIEMTAEDNRAALSLNKYGLNGTTEDDSRTQNFDSGIREPAESDYFLNQSLLAVEELDQKGLEEILSQGVVALGRITLTKKVILPLMEQIGELWRQGTFRIVHEHMSSSVVRSLLDNLREGYEASESAPLIIGVTPIGQHHEFGVLSALTTAASEGWRTLYLGTNLPSEEIAAAIQKTQPLAVILSLIYPSDDGRLISELRRIRQFTPEETTLICGGKGMEGYRDILEELNVKMTDRMEDLRPLLRDIRAIPQEAPHPESILDNA